MLSHSDGCVPILPALLTLTTIPMMHNDLKREPHFAELAGSSKGLVEPQLWNGCQPRLSNTEKQIVKPGHRPTATASLARPRSTVLKVGQPQCPARLTARTPATPLRRLACG